MFRTLACPGSQSPVENSMYCKTLKPKPSTLVFGARILFLRGEGFARLGPLGFRVFRV